jgi:hypothetical protein
VGGTHGIWWPRIQPTPEGSNHPKAKPRRIRALQFHVDFLFSSSPKSARGLAQSKTLARQRRPHASRERLGVRRPYAAFAHALYDFTNDLAERHNLIADATPAGRVKAVEKLYRELRASKRSTVAQ